LQAEDDRNGRLTIRVDFLATSAFTRHGARLPATGDTIRLEEGRHEAL
jgi:hypothetical protein